MSHLIHMRQRIKAVETIKKITSAMRLISRSFHTKLNKQRDPLSHYQNELCTILQYVKPLCPTWAPSILGENEITSPSRFFPTADTPKRELFIIIGSQKGLCGNFNRGIFYWIDTHRSALINSSNTVICAGKKAEEYLTKQAISIFRTYPEIKLSKIGLTTHEIIETFMNSRDFYTNVTVISNSSQNFFSYKTHTRELIPFIGCAAAHNEPEHQNYIWEHNPEQVLDLLARNILKTSLHTAIFESLHAEQSARFISMDNATRNANTFLDAMKLQYNKARQAKITKELTELAIYK